MSSASTLRRQRAKRSRPTARKLAKDHTPQHVPGVLVPTCAPPRCRGCRLPMVYVACACHPREASWQCSNKPLSRTGHMVVVRLPDRPAPSGPTA